MQLYSPLYRCTVLTGANFADMTRNVKRFRAGLVFKAHRLVYHSTLGWRVIKKKKKNRIEAFGADEQSEEGIRMEAAFRPRGENNLEGYKSSQLKNGSSQGQNLALTGLFVPKSPDSRPAVPRRARI